MVEGGVCVCLWERGGRRVWRGESPRSRGSSPPPWKKTAAMSREEDEEEKGRMAEGCRASPRE